MYKELRNSFPEKCRSIDPNEWENIFVVGDVHGCSQEFLNLIKKIDLDDDELMVCVGDITRKGPDSAGAVNIIRNYSNIMSVLGNQEAKYLRGDKDPRGLDESHREYIDTWPLIIAWPGNAVVHGGFNPAVDPSEHNLVDVVNMRSPKNQNNYKTPFWFDEYTGSTRIFFGHTVSSEPIDGGNTIGLDTGCVYGGKLTAFDVNEEEFLHVPSLEEYHPRDASKYADNLRGKESPTF